MSPRRRGRGFTLIEVLVALAVLAIALGAIIKATAQQIDNAAYLRDRTLAEWVGMNRLAELQLAPSWPDKGSRSGSVEMARREWFWQYTVVDTPDPDVRRVDIKVRAKEEDKKAVLATLSGFIGRGRQAP